jgi:hypothetical protein
VHTCLGFDLRPTKSSPLMSYSKSYQSGPSISSRCQRGFGMARRALALAHNTEPSFFHVHRIHMHALSSWHPISGRCFWPEPRRDLRSRAPRFHGCEPGRYVTNTYACFCRTMSGDAKQCLSAVEKKSVHMECKIGVRCMHLEDRRWLACILVSLLR